MQFNTLLLIASFVGVMFAVPIKQDAEGKAVVNSRFITYENEARDAADEKKAVINSRFLTYETKEKRDDASKEAMVNARFATSEAQ